VDNWNSARHKITRQSHKTINKITVTEAIIHFSVNTSDHQNTAFSSHATEKILNFNSQHVYDCKLFYSQCRSQLWHRHLLQCSGRCCGCTRRNRTDWLQDSSTTNGLGRRHGLYHSQMHQCDLTFNMTHNKQYTSPKITPQVC